MGLGRLGWEELKDEKGVVRGRLSNLRRAGPSGQWDEDGR